MSTKPTLRLLDFQPVLYQGQQMWLLRDPLNLSEYQIILPQALAQLVLLVDGTRDEREIYEAFCQEIGEQVDYEVVKTTLTQLDQACLLDNKRSLIAKEAQLALYRAQPYRPPALAGLSYPEAPVELDALFSSYSEDDNISNGPGWKGRALISPHIDYQRGGSVYAKVWRRAMDAIADADLVLIFGTDHSGGFGSITLTEQAYATPFGILPTDLELVGKLAEAIGPEKAFDLELNHREEHSVELSAVWLHYIYWQLGQKPAPMVPILCGSFHHFVNNGHHPSTDHTIDSFIKALRTETAGRKVLTVASVDLAHVGPNFGDPFPMDNSRRRQLLAGDVSLIEAINDGNYARFYQEIAAVQDCNRICGFSSIYMMLRYLEHVRGTKIAYEHCPADAQDTSLVSICGLLLE